MKRKRLVSAVLACAMTVGLTSLPAVAAEAPTEAEVTEMTVGENTVFVYAPERDMVVSSTCTAPCFIVFGSEPYTADSASGFSVLCGLSAPGNVAPISVPAGSVKRISERI